MLFPEPLPALNYTYTTTGVLERAPSFENGDIELRPAEVYLDATGAITVTATDVITTRQQLVVTYRWNPALRWSDGMPVTASDSVFAYELAKELPLSEELRSRRGLLESYEQVDDHTSRAILKPDYTDPMYIQTVWTPLPRHLLQDVSAADLLQSEYALQPVGYGPFMIESRERGAIRMVRNPYYFGAAPLAETVSFVFLSSVEQLHSSVLGGSLDVAVTDKVTGDHLTALDRDAQNNALHAAYTPSPVWEHLNFNLDVPLLQDIRVRQAIAHGINRQGMIDALLGGHTSVLDSWVLPGQWAAAPRDQLVLYPYDPDRSRQLLDEVGLLDSNGDGLRELAGAPLQIRLLTTEGSPLRLAIAERFVADMVAIGITVNVQPLSTAELYAQDGPLFRREFELVQFAWIAGSDPRGWELWSCTAVPSQSNNWTGNNFPGWCFFEADQSIRTATTSLDRAERAAAYLRQQQLFTQELPLLPLFQRLTVTMYNPNMQGLQPDPLAPITWNIATWSRDQ
jgi:peptide/nickel transport system substrate-binding protein